VEQSYHKDAVSTEGYVELHVCAHFNTECYVPGGYTANPSNAGVSRCLSS